MSKQPKIKYKYKFACRDANKEFHDKIIEIDKLDDELAIATFESIYNYYTWFSFINLTTTNPH